MFRITNSDAAEPIVAQLQKLTNDILCINEGCILINPPSSGLTLSETIDDKYIFNGNDNNSQYIIFGHDVVERWMKNNIKLINTDVESIELEPVYGEPIIDIVEEIVDNHKKLDPCIEVPVNLPNNIKMVRIISADRKNITEIMVPEKSDFEVIEHSIV